MLLTSQRYGQPLVEFDPKVEAKLRMKIDLMVVPTVAILYLFCFIDRANIGQFLLSKEACGKSKDQWWLTDYFQEMLVSPDSKKTSA